jgi:hypothetical protein
MDCATYLKAKEIKHRADLTCGDVLLLDDGNHFHFEEKTFIRVVCDGYCGRDEFWGYVEETGKRIAWCNGDLYKIIGQSLTPQP